VKQTYVAGVGLHPFGKHPDKGLKELAFTAIWNALEDAGVEPQQIEIAHVGNAYGGLLTGQESVRGQVILRYAGLSRIPIVNVENACASASTAFFQACLAIESGQYDVALAVGVEKLYVGDTARSIRALATSADVELMGKTGIQFSGIYAMKARQYMEQYGAQPRHLAMVAVKNSANGALNPYAQFRKALDIDTVLNARPICEPLTLYMCSSIADGAAAAVVVSERFLRRHGGTRAVRVAASELGSGAFDALPDESDENMIMQVSRRAYERAGLGPQEINLAEVHDAAAPIEFLHAEDLGFCGPGEGYQLVETHATDPTGRIPINVSGGLLARGHPAGATGLAQIAEVVWQLRGEAGPRQIGGGKPPSAGLCLNTGGRVGDDRAATALHILTC
jgi:acetyl-CoA acetyltransferase